MIIKGYTIIAFLCHFQINSQRKIGLGIEKIKLPAVKVLRRITATKKNVTCPRPLLGRQHVNKFEY